MIKSEYDSRGSVRYSGVSFRPTSAVVYRSVSPRENRKIRNESSRVKKKLDRDEKHVDGVTSREQRANLTTVIRGMET